MWTAMIAFVCGRDRSLCQFGIETICIRTNVYQHGESIREQDGAGGSNEGKIGHDHFIPGLQPDSAAIATSSAAVPLVTASP